ncbi:MAG: hypothetical protein KGQ41_04695 [Alphaproteobacteria bacterium]|nr:hypothetical protein [Alphaproteobacteria bacterium]
MLALIFVAFFGGVLAGIAIFNRNAVRVAEAEVAGWELVQIGKAARLYMRDQLVANPALRNTSQTPTRITMAALKNGGYLPQTFGRSVGALDYNALNQEVYVIMANWLPTGLTLTNDASSVPSAFVLFRAGGKSDPNRVLEVVESARKNGATITAPLFDFNNNNRSADCKGTGAAAGLWDTGCLSQAEYNSLATSIGLPAGFRAGALIVPAWKMSQHDLRAVMRYPQPENPGFATMLTDLGMAKQTRDNDGTDDNNCNPTAGDPGDTDEVTIRTVDASGNPTTTSTGLCDVVDDTAAATGNNRFNITNVANLTAERMVAEPQAADTRLVAQPAAAENGGVDTAQIGTGNDEAFNVTGTLTLGNDLRVFNNRSLNGIATRFAVPASIAVERNAYLYSQSTTDAGIATIGTITSSNSLITDSLTTGTLTSTSSGVTAGSSPRITATNSIAITGTTSVTGTANSELISENITGGNATLTATDNTGKVQITNTLSMTGQQLSVTGTEPVSGYSAIVGDINDADNVNVTGIAGASQDLQFLSTNGTLSADSTRSADNTGNMPTITATNSGASECLEGLNVADACPNRQYFVPFITP